MFFFFNFEDIIFHLPTKYMGEDSPLEAVWSKVSRVGAYSGPLQKHAANDTVPLIWNSYDR